MDTKVAESLLGALVDGRYRIRSRVARGGMATVYTATDERLERTVALKIIHPVHAHDAQFLARFGEEAKTIARLAHPNVVGVYDQGTYQGLPYLVMEYVRGRTLREVLTERGRLSALESLAILEQVLAAVAAAHRAGLVHRDIKPENILVAQAPTAGTLVDAVVKVADFGLAQAVEASTADASAGNLMATVAYVAPELIESGRADPRSDVYSAGIVLFEMLTGSVPYDGDQPVDVAWQHVDRDVPAPGSRAPDVPSIVDGLALRATRRDPAARPTDAGAMLNDVQSVRDDVSVAAERDTYLAGQPTTMVSQLDGIAAPTTVISQRPTWARLPESRPPRPRGGRKPKAAPRSFAVTWARMMRRRGGRLAIGAAALVVVVLLGAGVWWLAAGRYTTAPTLIGKTRADAVAIARHDGFTVRFGEGRFNEKIAKDQVLTQTPGAAARIVKGSAITLTLSRGAERYKVPDVVGRAFDVATEQLAEIKATPARSDAYSDTIPTGSVIRTDPPVGTEVQPNARIAVVVSKGKAPITMPSVINQDFNAAKAQLEGMGLKVAQVTAASDKPLNQVIAQDPPDGTGLEQGAQVTLTTSQGPPQVPVPPVTGMTVAQATATLQAAGFTVAVNGNPDPNAHVVVQYPTGNQPKGSQITLVAL